ncbi:MAG: tetratricopeptide repeat protein [Planctomycetota bacterium]
METGTMAARVNYKFVIILTAVLVGVCAAGIAAYVFVIDKSGQSWADDGDEAMAAGEYADAVKAYGRAVGHERANVEWLEKWANAMEQLTFDDRGAYTRAFQQYVPVIRQIARVKQSDLDAHLAYFDLMFAQSGGNNPRPLAEVLNNEVEAVLPMLDAAGSSGEVIRRYRGLAFVQVLAATGELPENEFERTEADLRSALAADPTDGQAATSLVRMINTRLEEARRLDRLIAIERTEGEIDAAVSALVEAAPNDPWTQTLVLATAVDEINREASANTPSPAAREAQIRSRVEGLRDQLDALQASLLASDPGEIEAVLLEQLQLLERLIDPEARNGRSRELYTSYIEQRPEDAVLLVRYALLLGELGELDEAIVILDTARGLPPKPLSVEGVTQFGMKAIAARFSSDFHLRIAGQLDDDDPEREAKLEAALEEAIAARHEYASLVPTGAADLQLLDGMIAITEKRFADAIAELSSFNAATNFNDRRGVLLEARVALELNRPGTARDRFTQLSELEPTNPDPLVQIARIERSSDDAASIARAIRLCEQALDLRPSYEPAQLLLTQLRLESGETSSGDPALDVIYEARRIERGNELTPGDEAAAMIALREGLAEHNFDPRVARELASRLLNADRLDEARAVIEEARTRHPDDEGLVRIGSLLTSDTVADAVAQLIEDSDIPPIQKALGQYRVFNRAGRTAEANEYLDQAIAIDADDPAVLEVRFRNAVVSRDLELAGEIAGIAEDVNADSMNGVSYAARLAAAEGRAEDAVQLFEEAIETGRADANVYRALAVTQRSVGRNNAALESFTRALEIRPDDTATIFQYVSMLASLGRTDEALEAARRFRSAASGSEDFTNLYLTLEVSAGGPEGRRRAIAQRRRLLTEDPTDRRNRGALAVLFIEDRQWLEARTLIDELRAGRDGLDVVALDARWYADQGRVRSEGEFKSGIELAQRVFVEYIIGLDDETAIVDAYLSLARFMIQRGQYGVAVRAIDDARPQQDPEQLRAEKLFGDLMLTLGRSAEAAGAFRLVVDSGADDENQSYRKRLIEMLLRQNEFAAAEEQIDALGSDFADDLTIMMQQADVLIGQGRRSDALSLLNRAVSLYQDTPVVYAKRAQVLISDPDSLSDALADLETALEIQPDEWRTLRLRSSVYYRLGRVEDALTDLRAALRVNPTLDEVLLGLMIELVSLNRDGEALDAAIEVIDQRPTDTTLMITAGRVLSDRALWGRAAVLYGRAWELSQDPELAIRYIDSLVNADPPRPDDAERVLRRVIELTPDAGEDSELLIAQALIEDARGRSARATSFLSQAFDATGEDIPSKLNWIRNVVRLYSDQEEGAAVAFVRDLQIDATDTATRDWLEYAAARMLLDRDSSFEDGTSVLSRLADDASLDVLRLLSYRTLGAGWYEREDFAAAESTWRSGLEAFPEDWEMQNNLAYCVGVELGRAEDAIPLARRAVELAPNQSQAWDTLAKLQILLGQYDDAEVSLDEGSKYMQNAAARINITLNRARIALAREECDVARSLLTQARTSTDTLPQLRDRFETDIDDLSAQIEEGC